ncbi:MAG: hypothetical protein KDI75_07255 [Xanthomonadales bacterium]|nr:hypothetical protein [Xanthomonadales bacterium]
MIEAAVALANGDHKSPAMALLASEQAMFAVGGQSTGIIVSVTDDSFHGASVGDSECWWLVDGGFVDLTAAQARKPLLGDGAMPVPFGPFPLTGRLLVATDGLFNYAHSDHILQITTDSDIDTVAQQLADLPRLPDGEWPDDMALILINLEAAQLIDHEHL